jgi:Kef-type K+ transport system membrane component KefB
LSGLSTTQVVGFVLFDLALILVVARFVGWVFTRIGQPRVVGEIVAGVLLGPTLLGPTLWPDFVGPAILDCAASITTAPAGTVPSPTWCLFPAQSRLFLAILGQLGLMLFMFLTGLEMDSSMLRGKARAVTLVGLGVVVVPVLAGFVVGPLLSNSIFRPEGASELGFTLFVGAMIAVTAFPVMARILQEKGLTTSAMGSIGVAAAAVCTVAMFVTAAVASSVVAGASSSEIAIKVVLMAGFLVAMFYLVRPMLVRIGARYRKSDSMSSGYFALVLIMLLISALIAHALGLTVIVGGFVFGIVLPDRERLFADMRSRMSELTTVVLLPVFLAFSGLGTDFTQLSVAALGGLAVLLVAAVASKWLAGAGFARLGGLTWAEGNVLGILMNCRGLLVLVVAIVGVSGGVITPVLQLGAVLIALITTAMTGPLFDRASRRLPAETS